MVNVPARGIGQKTVADLQQWAARLALSTFQVAKLAADGTEEIGHDGRIAPVVPMATRPRSLVAKFVTVIETAQERLARRHPEPRPSRRCWSGSSTKSTWLTALRKATTAGRMSRS